MGLMTIGMPDYTSRPENFHCLLKCRTEVGLYKLRIRRTH
jgi:hypothetical protein